MSDISLKQGIAAIYDMELNNYFMTRMRRSLEESLNEKVRRNDTPIEKPYNKPIIPVDPSKPDSASHVIGGATIGAIAGAILKFVIGLISYLIEYNSVAPDATDAVLDRAPAIIFGNFWTWVLVTAAAGLIIGIFVVIGEISKYKKKKGQYDIDLKKYYADMDEYEKAMEEYNKQVDLADELWAQKVQARKAAIHHQITLITDKLSDSSNLLNSLYDKIGIDDKYRNIVPIAYMHEFINLGIATKLEGADGLYYLTMKELKMDQMQYKLDTIITKLDSLIDKQRSIYGELLALNNKCDTMALTAARQTDALLSQNSLIQNQNALLAKIESNSEIVKYNSERIAKEQEYQSYMIRYQNWS